MRKTIAGFCTVFMLGLTLSVAAAQTPGNGYDDGNTFTNPWGTLFSTPTAKESKTTRKETTTETRMGYASDLRTFFRFLLSANPELSARQIDAKKNIAIDDNKNQAANDHTDSSDNAAVLDSYISGISLKDIESLKPVDIEDRKSVV